MDIGGKMPDGQEDHRNTPDWMDIQGVYPGRGRPPWGACNGPDALVVEPLEGMESSSVYDPKYDYDR